MRAYRIADRRFPLLDGTGARMSGGRWNTPGKAVIYAAETFAGAMLEILAHSNLGRPPLTYVVAEISIPDNVRVETVKLFRSWDAEDLRKSRTIGDRWRDEKRTAVLLVPAMVSQGREHNVLLNPEHPGFRLITAGKAESVIWDRRLFRS